MLRQAVSSEDWVERAARIAPLLRFADDSWGGEAGVIEKMFSMLPTRAGFAIEFGQLFFSLSSTLRPAARAPATASQRFPNSR